MGPCGEAEKRAYYTGVRGPGAIEIRQIGICLSRHASWDEDYLAVGAWFHHGPVSARRIYKRHLLADDGV